jgi:hypothetical protein
MTVAGSYDPAQPMCVASATTRSVYQAFYGSAPPAEHQSGIAHCAALLTERSVYDRRLVRLRGAGERSFDGAGSPSR